MSIEMLPILISAWVSCYLALFTLLSLLLWGVGAYLFLNKWHQVVRDSSLIFIAAGVLALLLYLCPTQPDIYLWKPLTWFSFAMLLVLELFWIAYLIDHLVRYLSKIPARLHPSEKHDVRQSPTSYSRR